MAKKIKISALMMAMPHTRLCQYVRLNHVEIRIFWGIYITIAWVVPGCHWVYVVFCIARRATGLKISSSKKSIFLISDPN